MTRFMNFHDDPRAAANFLAGYLHDTPADVKTGLVILTKSALGEVPFERVAGWREAAAELAPTTVGSDSDG